MKRRSVLPGKPCRAPDGPLGVEFLDEIVEASLLLQEIVSGRLGCFKFQCQMHALMAAVLLRVARLDAFNVDVDAEPEPPDRQADPLHIAVRQKSGCCDERV
ncbi:hypothetical protein J2X76_002623 [Neorhizobium sp. 2083]|nr:hypothetical protein [Neorhizobium sp. 2083]